MSELFKKKQNRREFLSGIGRYMILGGVVSTAGVLAVRREPTSSEEEPTKISVCHSCTFLKRCQQPDALLARKEAAG